MSKLPISLLLVWSSGRLVVWSSTRLPHPLSLCRPVCTVSDLSACRPVSQSCCPAVSNSVQFYLSVVDLHPHWMKRRCRDDLLNPDVLASAVCLCLPLLTQADRLRDTTQLEHVTTGWRRNLVVKATVVVALKGNQPFVLQPQTEPESQPKAQLGKATRTKGLSRLLVLFFGPTTVPSICPHRDTHWLWLQRLDRGFSPKV
ncbi:unnamed protein product [Protopolystoma xenopodis]|uniref:Secreted protein n=1 Tax=Protopolystoma xenopodis TaxID=117903 RepID=A0A3S5AT11_9PLAT|nr:unnamed protein product [Protopolystoma xenopodis]